MSTLILFEEEGFDQLYEKIVQLKLVYPDGKLRETDGAKKINWTPTQILHRKAEELDHPDPSGHPSREGNNFVMLALE